MIAFRNCNRNGTRLSHAATSGESEMGTLAEGIYTAMTTTVAGLIVGIIAYIGYNHLVVKKRTVVHTRWKRTLWTS
jgi:biopolymer transport protein ExbB/TolQ